MSGGSPPVGSVQHRQGGPLDGSDLTTPSPSLYGSVTGTSLYLASFMARGLATHASAAVALCAASLSRRDWQVDTPTFARTTNRLPWSRALGWLLAALLLPSV